MCYETRRFIGRASITGTTRNKSAGGAPSGSRARRAPHSSSAARELERRAASPPFAVRYAAMRSGSAFAWRPRADRTSPGAPLSSRTRRRRGPSPAVPRVRVPIDAVPLRERCPFVHGREFGAGIIADGWIEVLVLIVGTHFAPSEPRFAIASRSCSEARAPRPASCSSHRSRRTGVSSQSWRARVDRGW